MQKIPGTPSYQLSRSSRSRRIRITVHPGGGVVVTAPKRMSQFSVETFVSQKSAWILKAIARQSRYRPSLLPPASAAQYARYKEAARSFVIRRMTELNERYHFTVTKILIRNQKHLWGSCSKNGVITINYRILFLPPELADYIIAHELCHRKEMNHSPHFWQLVGRVVPNPKGVRRQFKLRGFALS